MSGRIKFLSLGLLVIPLALIVSCGDKKSDTVAETPGSTTIAVSGDAETVMAGMYSDYVDPDALGEPGFLLKAALGGEIYSGALFKKDLNRNQPDKLKFPLDSSSSAHAKYISAPSKFVPLPLEVPAGQGKLVCVGSEVAKLYPGVSAAAFDVKNLPAGVSVPFGTLLRVSDAIRNALGENEHGDFFQFEKEKNYFYETAYDGKKGVIFGADLYGIYEDEAKNEENVKLASVKYFTSGVMKDFYPYYSFTRLSGDLQKRLEENRIAVDRVDPTSYQLSSTQPDDMVALYQNEVGNHRLGGYTEDDLHKSIFITTDLFSHSMHLLFDRYMQQVEETFFAPRLALLVNNYLEKIDALIASDDKSVPEYSRTLKLARLYFEVPQMLLELAPERKVNEVGDNPMYFRMDTALILSSHSPEAREIFSLMDKHEGFASLPEFKYDEDFSQYVPRGHYTKNGILSQYFLAMMWFGRIHMYISDADPPPYIWKSPDTIDSAKELSLQLTPTAVLINRLTRENPSLYEAWQGLFEPMTYLIGVSDDLSFDDVMPFLDGQDIKNFMAWTADDEAIIDLVKKADKELRPPRITGNSVLHVPAGKNDTNGFPKPPMGWRLFGQRFTWDSFVHTNASSPRLFGRMMVSGLDIMKALGSRTADRLLTELPAGKGGYADSTDLKAVLDGFEIGFEENTEDFWSESFYNRTLLSVKTLADFEQGSGFYFTETPAWNTKALLTSHGTWAELRHDTLLYVKQTYAEYAGDDEGLITFRIKPLPRPVNYIEPNLPFFRNLRATVWELVRNMKERDLMPHDYGVAFDSLYEMITLSLEIVETECADKPIATSHEPYGDDQNNFIRSIPQKLASIVYPGLDRSASVDPKQLRMAVVSDVFTNAESRECLEVAVGVPYKIWLLLNDGQGGKRVAVGYTFSYYEFPHPMSDRMTDEAWRDIVYKPEADLSNYVPSWAKDFAR